MAILCCAKLICTLHNNRTTAIIGFGYLSRVLFSHKANWEVMAYFSAYFDESYQEGSPMMAVAGYVATDEGWIEFAERWSEIVTREGVTAFHWSDLETFKGEFTRDKGWDETRRLAVQKELIPIIKETISFGMCVGINVPEYEQHLLDLGKLVMRLHIPTRCDWRCHLLTTSPLGTAGASE